MKAITLHQPWATLVAYGYKAIETRSWPVPSRHLGHLVAIHAGRQEDSRFRLASEVFDRLGVDQLPRGAVVAVARIMNCRPTEELAPAPPDRCFGDYSPGRYGWELGDVRPISTPVYVRGYQGLWMLPDEAEEAVWQQLNDAGKLPPEVVFLLGPYKALLMRGRLDLGRAANYMVRQRRVRQWMDGRGFQP